MKKKMTGKWDQWGEKNRDVGECQENLTVCKNFIRKNDTWYINLKRSMKEWTK